MSYTPYFCFVLLFPKCGTWKLGWGKRFRAPSRRKCVAGTGTYGRRFRHGRTRMAETD